MSVAICIALVLGIDPKPANLAGQCKVDADCTMSSSGGCCGSCCPQEPWARSLADEAAEQQQCAIVDCAAPQCAAVKCKAPQPITQFAAVCRDSTCVRVTIDLSQQCNNNSECTVEYTSSQAGCASSVCGCCPGMQPLAVKAGAVPQSHLRRPPPPQPPPASTPLTQPDGKPPFGLSQGATPTPRPQQPPPQPLPNCSPCPSPPPARAICAEHHCVLDRLHAL